MDGLTDKAGCRVACTRLKTTLIRIENEGWSSSFHSSQNRTSRGFNLNSSPKYGLEWCVWVCQYAKCVLIRSSSSGNVKKLILRYLQFFFFPISFILHFFLKPHLAPNLYIVVQLVLHQNCWSLRNKNKALGYFISDVKNLLLHKELVKIFNC